MPLGVLLGAAQGHVSCLVRGRRPYGLARRRPRARDMVVSWAMSLGVLLNAALARAQVLQAPTVRKPHGALGEVLVTGVCLVSRQNSRLIGGR